MDLEIPLAEVLLSCRLHYYQYLKILAIVLPSLHSYNISTPISRQLQQMQKTPNLLATFSLARRRSRRDPDQIISRSQREDLLAGKKEISPRSGSDHIQIPTRRSSRWQEGDLAEIRIRSYPDPNKKIFLLARRRSRRNPDQIISRSQQEDLLAGKKEISSRSRSRPNLT